MLPAPFGILPHSPCSLPLHLADKVNGRTDGLTDGRTDGGEFNSPPSSLREAGDNYCCVLEGRCLQLQQATEISIILGESLIAYFWSKNVFWFRFFCWG